jgi:hypothetical protein
MNSTVTQADASQGNAGRKESRLSVDAELLGNFMAAVDDVAGALFRDAMRLRAAGTLCERMAETISRASGSTFAFALKKIATAGCGFNGLASELERKATIVSVTRRLIAADMLQKRIAA